MIPRTLSDWTVETLRELLSAGIFESDQFDFKESLPDSRDTEAKIRLRKTCAAFANSRGGFLVFGVKDDRALAPDERLVGLDSNVDFPARFGAFPNQLEPSVEWNLRNPAIPINPGSVVHVVHIPRSARRPHGIFQDDKCFFPKRTSKGNEPMSHQELRAQFLDLDRLLNDLAWLQAEFARIEALARRLNVEIDGERWSHDLLSTQFNVGDIRSTIQAVTRSLSLITPDSAAAAVDTVNQCNAVDSVLIAVSGQYVDYVARAVHRAGRNLLHETQRQLQRILHGSHRVQNDLAQVKARLI